MGLIFKSKINTFITTQNPENIKFLTKISIFKIFLPLAGSNDEFIFPHPRLGIKRVNWHSKKNRKLQKKAKYSKSYKILIK